MRKSNKSDKWSAAQGTALGTKAPGTAPRLILFLPTLTESETARWRTWEREILRQCHVCDTRALKKACRDHDCKPQCAHVSSCGGNGLHFLLSVSIETRGASVRLGTTARGRQVSYKHDRPRPTGRITGGSRQTHLLWMGLSSACVNV